MHKCNNDKLEFRCNTITKENSQGTYPQKNLFQGSAIRLKQENDKHTESEEERDVLTGRQKQS